MAYILIAIPVVLAAFLVWAILCPALKYHSLPYKIKASIIFLGGRVRAYGGFPVVTTEGIDDYKVDLKDVRKADSRLLPGDIGLHRYELTFSNYGIPGAFKHAWIVIDDHNIVEATQKGVMKRDQWYPLLCDYAIILRPRDVNQDDINKAVRRAKAIVGCDYDANFRFDLEEEDAEFGVRGMKNPYVRNITAGKFHYAFSCTETVGFSWYHCKDKLRLFRSVYAGREAIVADDYLRMNFDIVWVSPTITEEWLKEVGLHEEGRNKIAAFRSKEG